MNENFSNSFDNTLHHLVKIDCNAGAVRDVGLISGLGRSPREGNCNPLQSSCLENPTDGGAR